MRRPGFGSGCALAAALALAGCAAQPIGSFARPHYVAEAAQAQHDLLFRAGSAEFGPGEAARLHAFLAALALRPEDDVLVRFGRTGSDVLDRRRLAATHAALRGTQARLRLAARGGFSSAEPLPDTALVQVLRYDRLVVVCPNSGRSLEGLTYLTPLPRIGCANAINLATMTAGPRDLTAPRDLAPASAAVEAAAVGRHRAGQIRTTPLGSTGN